MGLVQEKTRPSAMNILKKQLLDAQELAAALALQNQQINDSLLDTQELLAAIISKGGTV